MIEPCVVVVVVVVVAAAAAAAVVEPAGWKDSTVFPPVPPAPSCANNCWRGIGVGVAGVGFLGVVAD